MSGGQRRRLSWTCVRRDPETGQDTSLVGHLSGAEHIMSIDDAAGVLLLSPHPTYTGFAASPTLERSEDRCERCTTQDRLVLLYQVPPHSSA